MIHKHAVSLVGWLILLTWASGWAQPTNVVVKSRASRAAAMVKAGQQIGDPALPLTVGEWVKGKPVKIQPGTNIYVIVFCTLSQANEFALTNLSCLQKLYQDKGLITVAISDESPANLRDFVQVRGADIDFTVAADGLASRTASNYQLAFDQFMSPRAYIVGRDGNVLWYGHPLRDDMGLVVDEIVSGRYNLEQTRKSVQKRQQMEVYLIMAHQNDPATAQAGRVMLGDRTNDAPALCDLAFHIATEPRLEQRDTALANAALDRAEQLAATNHTDIEVDRAILLFQDGRLQAGLDRARQALVTAQTDAEKSEAGLWIRAMETRLAAAKASQTNNPSGTNAPVVKSAP